MDTCHSPQLDTLHNLHPMTRVNVSDFPLTCGVSGLMMPDTRSRGCPPPHLPHWRLSTCDRGRARETLGSSRGRMDNTWRRGQSVRGHDMVERSGYTSLDILDGDCVRPAQPIRGQTQSSASNCDSSLKSVTKHPGTSQHQGQGFMSLGHHFFHNEDDSPLLVTSIDGISTQSRRISGPSSLERDNLSSSTFSLLTPTPGPETPQFLVKSRNGSPSKESYSRTNPATPYNSIRKRIKSVSIKYIKNRQRKKSEKMDTNNFEEGASGSGGSSFDFLNIDTKLKEISEKCSQLKTEAEQSIARLEMADAAKEERDNKEDFSVSQTEAQIEYSRR